jgi:hypothetical protein
MFSGLVGAVPVVTLARTVLSVVWVVSIDVGSVLEDRRLLFYPGDEYRSEPGEVPGCPGMPFGPQSRFRLAGTVAAVAALTAP